MSDNPDNGMAEDEETTRHLFALLYPDEESSSAVEDPQYEDDAELSDFRSLLGQFRELPDEEPSAAVSNKLLALAAKHAPAEKKEEGQGFFARLSDWLLPAVYHPGLASAATLVLVAGLAGTLYVNGKSKVAEPQTASLAEPPRSDSAKSEAPIAQEALGTVRLGDDLNADPAASADSPADVLSESENVATANDEEATDQEGLEYTAGASEDGFVGTKRPSKELADESSTFKAEAKRNRALDSTLGGVIGGEGKGGGGRDFGSGTKSSANKNDTQSSDSPGNANRKSGASRTEVATPEAAKKAKPVTKPEIRAAPEGSSLNKDKASDPKPPSERDTASPRAPKQIATPAPKPEPAPSADPPPPPATSTGSTTEEKKPTAPARATPVGDSDDAAADKGESEAPAKEPPADSKVDPAAQAAALHKQAVTAAKNNQCDKVKALGQTIRKLSSAYYDRTFLSDKKLTACLAPDVKK